MDISELREALKAAIREERLAHYQVADPFPLPSGLTRLNEATAKLNELLAEVDELLWQYEDLQD